MLQTNQSFAYAMFRDERAASEAVQQLISAEFATEQIGALVLDATGVNELPMRHKTGVAAGATLGTLLGATVGALTLSGLGVIAIGGAFTLFEAAAVGGVTGTLAGIVGGLGIWKDEFDFPHLAFEQGTVLVGAVSGTERAPAAKAALLAAGAKEVFIATRAAAEQQLRELAKHPRTP